ncbi:TadE/TadG family type IV pilus assembly protein [Sphingopyxis sp. MWB1]|uniref:TadE/TadG family type IV pilus assembly protein n=1 Tax=Sphingopyxis sp. MWB1 TaxID=1537715 RepID=UPI00051A54C6|nr:TadE/TadG family type IV pilus assembly protein [Sphingopyxis sp. MWB1]
MRHFWILLQRFRRAQDGVSAVEFALTGPIFLLLLLGIMDYSWQMYAKQVLQGAVADAARASTLERNALDQKGLDAEVAKRVKDVMASANLTFSRKAYEGYDKVGKPENFTDANSNSRYDSGECFEDVNGNGSWDTDRGRAGNGGADDVVLYEVTMRFNRVLPVWKMLGQSQEAVLQSSTVLRNQPFATQGSPSKIICGS